MVHSQHFLKFIFFDFGMKLIKYNNHYCFFTWFFCFYLLETLGFNLLAVYILLEFWVIIFFKSRGLFWWFDTYFEHIPTSWIKILDCLTCTVHCSLLNLISLWIQIYTVPKSMNKFEMKLTRFSDYRNSKQAFANPFRTWVSTVGNTNTTSCRSCSMIRNRDGNKRNLIRSQFHISLNQNHYFWIELNNLKWFNIDGFWQFKH